MKGSGIATLMLDLGARRGGR